MSVSKKVKKDEQRKAHLIVTAVVILVATLIVFELSPFGGNARFYAKWVECGRKPMAGGGELALGQEVISYKEPSAFQPLRFIQPEYFCTPLEAELAGYSANPNRYEFPNINSQ